MILATLTRSVVGAACDAWLAWQISPHRFAHGVFEVNERGGWRLVSQRHYSLYRRYRTKALQACLTFRRSLRVRLSRKVSIAQLGTEGLVANLLHVLEILDRLRPDASVSVEWVISGAEQGFRYGAVGQDVWAGLFRPLDPSVGDGYLRSEPMLEFAFWGTGKDYLSGRARRRHRERYHAALAKVEVSNPRVRHEVATAYDRFLKGRFSVGVHRRVGNPMVRNVQSDGSVPSISRLIDRIFELIRASQRPEWAVFLATDDAEAIPPFKAAFGERLLVLEQVQRTTAEDEEVHYSSWGRLSLADAEDVLIDTLLLARCDVMVHGSSSISTMASLVNPELELVRLSGGR